MIVQEEEEVIFNWVVSASRKGGDFIRTFATAVLRADDENYPILRTAVLALREKYPKYNGD